MKLFHDAHSNGGSGLTLVTTYHKILNTLGVAPCGDAYSILRRQLRRLTRTTVEFRGHNKKYFIGSFIGDMSGTDEADDSKCVISLSPYLMSFYKADEYTRMKLSDLQEMSDYEQILHLFSVSHEGEVVLPLQKFIELSGKETVSGECQRDLKKKAAKGIEKLKSKNLLAPESQIDKSNNIVIKNT
jgi:hypothetical protein